ncbi:MAG: hypothetical protein AB3N11_08310 [Arenibacterium sp.]
MPFIVSELATVSWVQGQMFKSRFLGGALLAAAGFTSPQSGASEPRVYSGVEAQALRCAAYVSYTPVVLERRGLMSERETQEGALAATAIIGAHVSGTYEQKRRAFEIALSRLPESENALIEESVRLSGWCKEQFLP